MLRNLCANGYRFIRIQVKYTGKTGKPVGIFGACHHLKRANRLTADETDLFTAVDNWFTIHLPEPPFYANGNPEKAITWFKAESTKDMLERLQPLIDLLVKYHVDYEIARSNNPGRVIYEDRYQIAVT